MTQYRAVIEVNDYVKPTQLFGQNVEQLIKVLLPELERQSKSWPDAELVVYRVTEVEVERHKPTPRLLEGQE